MTIKGPLVFFLFTAGWLRVSRLCNVTFTGFVFHPTVWRHWRAGLDHLIIADMALFNCFPIKMPKRHCFTHRAKQSSSEKNPTIVMCICLSPELSSDTLLAAATMIQTSPDLNWTRDKTPSAPTPKLNCRSDWSEPELILYSAWWPPGGSTEPDQRPSPCRRRFLSGRWGLLECQTLRSDPCPAPELCRRRRTTFFQALTRTSA